MAINFPANPNINDVHTEASLGKSWKWDGATWIIYSSGTTGIAFGDLSVSQQAASGSGSLTYNNAGVFTYTPPVASSTTFTALGDTPNTFTSDKWLKVNSGGTALEFVDAPSGGGGGTNTTYDLTASSGSVVTEEKIKLSGSDNSEDAVTLAVEVGSGLTIARANNTITFGGAPTTIAVVDESIDIECYPLFTTEATGNLAPKTGSNIKFNSSTGQLEAGSFKKSGGSSAEFLKADGSIDSNTYSQSNHTHSYSLNDLSNVDAVTGAANGKILKYNGASWEIADDLTGGANTLGALTDVNTTGAVNGKIIKFNGTSWVIADDASSGGGGSANFTGLSDTPSTLTAGKWLKVNAGATALEWTDAPSGSDTNTTYGLTAVVGGSAVNIRLTGSDSTEDNVLLTPGSGLSLANITADGFTINSTDTLDTITGRGATTNNDVTVGSITCNDLTVNGTTTTVNSNTVNIGDSNLTLNSDETGTPSQNGGLTIERGTETNVELRWNETSNKWQYTNDGTNFFDIGSSSASTFLELSDTPSSFTADKWLKADVGGLSWTDPITYDMVTDAVTGGGIIRLTNELDNTTDDIQILGGTSITVDRSADHKLTINSDITNLNSLDDVVISGSIGDDSILQYDTNDQKWKPVDGDSVGTTIPTGTIVMFNGTTAPAGWVLCDNSSQAVAAGAPDLRDKFIIGAGNSYTFDDTGGSADAVIVSHDHGGSSNTGSQSANHNHNAGNQSANHTHGDGNYNTNSTGDHYHEQSGSGSGTTGNQSVNHFHTIGAGTTDGTPAKTSANTGGGTHGHGFQGTDRHPQSNMSGIVTEGGSEGGINNWDIQSSSGSHNHSVDLTGVTTGGINTNHTHNFSFNIGGNTTYSSIGDHAHNVQGSSGTESANHTHNLGNQNASHTHSFNIGTQGVSGSGKNIPPYYALTFIMKT